MDESILTNPSLLKYWNETRGGNKTRLSVMDVLSIGVHCMCYEILPVSISPIRWCDYFLPLTLNGALYQATPDIIKDSLSSFSEEKSMSNNEVSFKLSNIDNSSRILAMSGKLDKAKVNITLVITDPYTSAIVTSQLLFSGYTNGFTCTVNPIDKKNEMTVSVNSIYKKLDLSPRTLAANSVYQSYWPGDEEMALLGQVNKADQYWKYK
ncbi:DUF2163 domain-containing protein [Klebsiella variicola subsp. variicola]|uniref:DUF2163 domain-containing protein n=1 Tax=Klebsiella variicola TaxID=244366 RepID=UPI002FE2ADB4